MTEQEFRELKVGDWVRTIDKRVVVQITEREDLTPRLRAGSQPVTIPSSWEKCDPPVKMVDWIDACIAMRKGKIVAHEVWSKGSSLPLLKWGDGGLQWTTGAPYFPEFQPITREKEWIILPE